MPREQTILKIFGHGNPIKTNFDPPLENVTHVRLLGIFGIHTWFSVPEEQLIRGEGTNEVLTIPPGNYGLHSLTAAMVAGSYRGIDIRRRTNEPNSRLYLEVVKGILPPYLEHILGLDDPPRRAIELNSLITVDDFVVHCDMIDERFSLINGKQSTAVGTFHNDHYAKYRWFVDNSTSNEQHTSVWYRLKDEPSFSAVTMTLKNTFGQPLNTHNSSFHYTLAFK